MHVGLLFSSFQACFAISDNPAIEPPGAAQDRVQAHCARDDVLHERVGPGFSLGGVVFHRPVDGRGDLSVGKPLGCGKRERQIRDTEGNPPAAVVVERETETERKTPWLRYERERDKIKDTEGNQ